MGNPKSSDVIQEALRLARKRQLITPRGSSSISRFCAILFDGTSRFIGYNSYRSHPLAKQFSDNPEKICVHSEVDAIIRAKAYFQKVTGTRRDSYINLSDFDIYVARVLADGTPGNAKPCKACQEALDWFGIKEIYHT